MTVVVTASVLIVWVWGAIGWGLYIFMAKRCQRLRAEWAGDAG